MSKLTDNTPWFRKKSAIILLLIFVWPAGLYLMWRHTAWAMWLKALLSAVLVLFWIPVTIALFSPLKPVIEIHAVQSGRVEVESATYTVRGSLSGATKDVKVTVNDTPALRTDNDFYLEIDLEEGDNQVSVRAEHANGSDEKLFIVHRVATEKEAVDKEKDTDEESETSEETEATPTETPQSSSQPATTQNSPAPVPTPTPQKPAAPRQSGYESIYNDYAARLRSQCPSLSMMECAELSNEGVMKMAEYMYTASGTEGQYATYESWAGKLQDVYMAVVQ